MASMRVRLRSPEPSLCVAEVTLEVPAKTGRKGLTEVVKHLLGEDSSFRDEDIRLAFVVDRRLLQSSLARHVVLHGLSVEEVLDVEFFFASAEPTLSSSTDHDDWVGACAGVQGGAIAGTYDGGLTCVVGRAGSATTTGRGGNHPKAQPAHDGAVKAIAVRRNQVASGGHDAVVRVWSLEAARLTLAAEGVGHATSVGCVAWSPDGATVVSGDFGGMVFAWKPHDDAAAAARDELTDNVPLKKKARTVRALVPTVTHKAHAQAVLGAAWASAGPLYTSSMDHSLKQWDVVDRLFEATASANASSVQTCVDWSERHHLAAAGGHDYVVRLWDAKSPNFAAKLQAHTQALAAVAWRPDADHHLLSVAHDAQIFLWDIRATNLLGSTRAPLHRFTPPAALTKALCVAWAPPGAGENDDGAASIFVGGDDKQLREYKLR